jgi:hypothetical protein
VAGREFGYGTTEARDVSKVGMEQCLDMMAAMFHRQDRIRTVNLISPGVSSCQWHLPAPRE